MSRVLVSGRYLLDIHWGLLTMSMIPASTAAYTFKSGLYFISFAILVRLRRPRNFDWGIILENSAENRLDEFFLLYTFCWKFSEVHCQPYFMYM
jgi:hypothetical protein